MSSAYRMITKEHKMSYLVCIPTAGVGSRLGKMTKYLNKSLLSVGKKAILSLLIEQFPADAVFVIALGYQGHLVREFLQLAYPRRRFIFAAVDPYQGPGSSLGHSLICCQNYLQAPFIFCSCDTLVTNPVPAPTHNWMGFAQAQDLWMYRTLSITDDNVTKICDKGQLADHRKAYIGLAAIVDFELFWQTMNKASEKQLLMGECYGMNALLPRGIKSHSFDWHDTGNPDTISQTRKALQQKNDPHILEKPNEAIWFVNNTVIKFSSDEDFIQKRVKRSGLLKGFCPAITASRAHMYQYEEVRGDIISGIINITLFKKLLAQATLFWERRRLDPQQLELFDKTCFDFYYKKTRERIALFYQVSGHTDTGESINDRPMPLLEDLLKKIDWPWLAQGVPVRFHGDFHFENIIYNAENEQFTFLDWRQDFGGNLETGDMYYDLAKLYHGLIVSHELVTKNCFAVDWGKENINYSFQRKDVLLQCEKEFFAYLEQNQFDPLRVRVLTALIFLNIAALHHHPYRELLYCLGKDMLSNIFLPD